MAEDAEKMGMIYKAVADENLQEEAMKIAQTLAKMPTKGIGLTKRLFKRIVQQYVNPTTKFRRVICKPLQVQPMITTRA
jgi:enoyl-CoA hydratase/carnithine racemase